MRDKKKKRKVAAAVKRVKEQTKAKAQNEPIELLNAPHSFVVYHGKVGKLLKKLMTDFRKVMEPYTASALKVRRCNVVKDYVAIAGYFHVSHLCMFTHTERTPYMKIGRITQGPTLTFQVHNYTLSSSVLSSLKRQVTGRRQYATHPLLVLNNFSGEGLEMQLMASMFQTLFPSINVAKVRLNDIHRCVMLNYNPADKTIDFRHYAIRMIPQGLSKGVKKLLQARVPDLSKFSDISEFITKSGNLSESEAEDDPASLVTLPQDLSSRGNRALQKSAVRLVELGPRMTLQLIKIENNLYTGDVLFHEYIQKSEQEKKKIATRLKQKRKLKEQRRKQQEINVQKKKAEKESHKQKSLEGMKRKWEETKEVEENIEDDDAEWYKKEVGEEPDKEMFPSHERKRKARYEGWPARKKMRKAGGFENEKKGSRLLGKKMRKVGGFENEKKGSKLLGRKMRKGGPMETEKKRNKLQGKKKMMKNKVGKNVKTRFKDKSNFGSNIQRKKFDTKFSSKKYRHSSKKT